MGKTPKKKVRKSRAKANPIKPRRITFTPEQRKIVSGLTAIGSSLDEIGATLRKTGMRISNRSLDNHLAKDPELREEYGDGIAIRNVKLRSVMFKQAQMMNGAGVHQSQFLAVNWLGMKRDPSKGDDGAAQRLNEAEQNEARDARARVTAKLESLSQRLLGRSLGEQSGVPAKLPPPVETGRDRGD